MKLNVLIGNLMMDIGQAIMFSTGVINYMKENYVLTILGLGIFLVMSFLRSELDTFQGENEQ